MLPEAWVFIICTKKSSETEKNCRDELVLQEQYANFTDVRVFWHPSVQQTVIAKWEVDKSIRFYDICQLSIVS